MKVTHTIEDERRLISDMEFEKFKKSLTSIKIPETPSDLMFANEHLQGLRDIFYDLRQKLRDLESNLDRLNYNSIVYRG
jgi:hypothetical protein